MNDRLTALRLFVRVARLGSFSAGGRDLSIPQPTVSRTISHLEHDLGVTLFRRTTRALSLTESGTDFLARVEPILAELDEAEYAVRGTGELRGTLKVGLSSSFAIREVAPRLPKFMQAHPRLRLELITDDQWQDLLSDGIDVGLRFGPLPDSTAIAKRISSWRRVIAGSPGYLKRAGLPSTPADLAAHSVIATSFRPEKSWLFTRNGKALSVAVHGNLMVTMNEVAIVAAVAGMGLVSMTLGACRRELEEGALVPILGDWDMGTVDVHAVFPTVKGIKASAREFAEFLVSEFATDSYFFRHAAAPGAQRHGKKARKAK
jgi:DNA-binding transcriptional LysR family regulator